jgi:putative transposase
MIKAHKIRLNPTAAQENYFYRAAGVARFAWNWALDEYWRKKAAGEEIDWNEIKIAFRAKIDREFPFVREVTKCAAEQAIADLAQAISTYYKTKQNHPKSKVKFPGYRKRGRKVGGFGLNNDKFRVSGHTVRVPKLGEVNMTEAPRFAGKVLNGRIKERAGRWYLIVTVEVEQRVKSVPSLHRSVGIDFGLYTFATLSNGEESETQAHYRQAESKLQRLQRGLARKVKGSRSRQKWKLKVARAYERIENLRSDFLHKFTRKVTDKYSIICVEDLSLVGLVQTRMAKSFQDAAIGRCLEMLEAKAKASGGVVQKVGRFFPSSKRCCVCGEIKADLKLSEREWECPQCGRRHQRDLTAAINIEMEGVNLLAGSGYIGVTPVEFAASGLKLVSI